MVVELIFSLTLWFWLRCPLGNSAGSFAVTSSTYWHRFSEHRYTVKLVTSFLL